MEFGGFKILLNFGIPFSSWNAHFPDFNIFSSFKWEEGLQVWPQDILSVMSEEAGRKAEAGKCEHLEWQKGCLFSDSKRTAHSKQIPECNRTLELL